MAINSKIFEALKTYFITALNLEPSYYRLLKCKQFANSFQIGNAVIKSGSICSPYYMPLVRVKQVGKVMKITKINF